MKILIYGINGYIASNIYKNLLNIKYINLIIGNSRCDNYEEVTKEIKEINPDRIICCIGRASGKNIYSTSFIEDKLDINLNDNLYSQIVLIKCLNSF